MTDQAAVTTCEHYYETRILGGHPLSVRICIFCRVPDWVDLTEQVSAIRDAARQASGQQPDTDAALFHAEGEHDRCGPECEPDRLRAALEEARGWARHGYEIGQRSCTWSDHGVAPAWLTDDWPVHFAGPDPAAGHVCDNCDGIDPATCFTNPERIAAAGLSDTQPTVDRATVLREAADAIDATYTGFGIDRYVRHGADLLRRMADEETPR
ncbi:MAG: hypothetical protein K0R62_3807 [Nonomuraea muscovyensis]|jgi:hypothetical protein|nr:hypothetical protein [Nonomuraea muscovyensis]